MHTPNIQKQPWYQTTRRWGQTNLTEEDPEKCDLTFWKEQWKRTRIQGMIINASGIVAYYPSRFPLQYRAALLGDKDYYGMWNDAARQQGLSVVARMDINRATKAFYKAHPDWFCQDQSGAPILSQGRYFSCVNSGYYTQYIPDVLREIIERYQPDGFSDNSWKGMGRDKICYCENCRKQFKAATGHSLPVAVDWDDPIYRDWIRWSYQTRTDNWDLFNRVTKAAGGKDCLWLGMLHADPVNLSGGFGDLKALCARSPILFSDHQSRDTLYGFEQNAVNGNLLRLASDENVLAPESMANYVRGPRSFRLASNPAPETRMWMAEGMAGGISPWYHHVGGGQNDRRQFETPVPLFQWHAQNEKNLYDRNNMANVGIVWSQENADFYGRGDAKEKVAYPWAGFCRALSAGRIPFLPIHANDITRYTARLKTLVLPELALLSPAQETAVCTFVQGGGNLVLSGMTAACAGDGIARTDSSPLMRLLGLERTGKDFGVADTASENWEHYTGHSYLRLPKQRHEMLVGFEQTDLLPHGGVVRQTQTQGRLRPIASYIHPFPIYPPEFSWIRQEAPEIGTIFAGTLDGGSRVVYFAADVDRCYGRDCLPDHARLLQNAVRWASAQELPLEVKGPGLLDCAIYRQAESIIVHLVNLSGCNRNPGYCDENYPVGPVTVSVRTGEHAFCAAHLTVAGSTVEAVTCAGTTAFQVQHIVDHEMIVLE